MLQYPSMPMGGRLAIPVLIPLDQNTLKTLPLKGPPTPDPQGEAETCFHKAIEIARRQGAKSLELRAVMSLSRLWQQQGKQHEARNLLSEIYSWFTEGFGTTDLREAKALRDQCADSNRLESLATN
jgi:hypothetical protein